MLAEWLASGILGALLAVACPVAWSFDAIRLTFEEGYRLESIAKRGKESFVLEAPLPHRGAGRREFPFVVGRASGSSELKAWLSPEAASGRRSLAFMMQPARDHPGKEKIMMNVVNNRDEERLKLGADNARYVGFDFMLDRTYEVPIYWVTHLQARQCCGDQPPFAMKVVPGTDRGGEVEFRFVVRDDDDPKTSEGGRDVYRMKVPRGQWNNIVFRLEPSHIRDGKEGRLSMWYNKVLKFEHRGDWGYNPDQKSARRGIQMSGDMFVGIGIYRKQQPTTQTILFDNVRYGTTLSSVVD
jgi:hypothetical protein